jgi:hypothetical protein
VSRLLVDLSDPMYRIVHLQVHNDVCHTNLVVLKYCDSRMLLVAVGGGVENVGVTRVVHEMLLVAPDGLFIEIFPFTR